MVLPAGYHEEILVIEGKQDLVVSGEQRAAVLGVAVVNSTGIVLSDLEIDAAGTGVAGLTVFGDQEPADVLLERSEVHGANADVDGVLVTGAEAWLAVKTTRIWGNGRHGLHFRDIDDDQEQIGYALLIEGNGWDGVHLSPMVRLQLSMSTVQDNGQEDDSYPAGRGIQQEREGPAWYPVTLHHNVIAGHGGEVVSGESSADLGNYDLFLGDDDVGNVTSTGSEGLGVIEGEVEAPTYRAYDVPLPRHGWELSATLDAMKAELIEIGAFPSLVVNSRWVFVEGAPSEYVMLRYPGVQLLGPGPIEKGDDRFSGRDRSIPVFWARLIKRSYNFHAISLIEGSQVDLVRTSGGAPDSVGGRPVTSGRQRGRAGHRRHWQPERLFDAASNQPADPVLHRPHPTGPPTSRVHGALCGRRHR